MPPALRNRAIVFESGNRTAQILRLFSPPRGCQRRAAGHTGMGLRAVDVTGSLGSPVQVRETPATRGDASARVWRQLAGVGKPSHGTKFRYYTRAIGGLSVPTKRRLLARCGCYGQFGGTYLRVGNTWVIRAGMGGTNCARTWNHNKEIPNEVDDSTFELSGHPVCSVLSLGSCGNGPCRR